MTMLDAQYSGFSPDSRTRTDARASRTGLKFRLKVFGYHLLSSTTLLTLVLGGLYLGWYRWPGWYLAGVSRAAITMMTVDVVLGPLLTLLIASPTKPGRVLARDIAVIAAVQIAALAYGATTLWQGRPLYYVYAVNRVEMFQARGIDSSEAALLQKQYPELAPTWHSLPQWVSAPFIAAPRDFTPWDRGVPELRKHLRKVDDQLVFTKAQKQSLERKMERLGYDVNQPDTIFLNGYAAKLLVVFDRASMRPEAILAPDP
jgi:hypothetical protein